MKARGLRWLLGALLLAAACSAQAGCKVNNGGATLNFGAYKPITFAAEITSADVLQQAGISIGCNQILAPLTCLLPLFTSFYSITISAGSGSATARQMPGSNGGPPMKYDLYSNSGRTVFWGDGVTGTTLNGSITGCNAKTHTVYGRVLAGQNTLKPGTFSEQLTITVSFLP